MGKTANARAWAEYERKQNKAADEAMGDVEPELSEFERASEWDDERWSKIDAEAIPRRVMLWDEMAVMR